MSANEERDRLVAIARRLKAERDQARQLVGEQQVQLRAMQVLLDMLWKLVGSDSARA